MNSCLIMKKIFFVALIPCFLLSLLSCDSLSSEQKSNVSNSIDFSEYTGSNLVMLNSLSLYNDSLLRTSTRANPTNTFDDDIIKPENNRRIRLWKVALVDALGGLVGGLLSGGSGAVIGAVFSSGAIGMNSRANSYDFGSIDNGLFLNSCAAAVYFVKNDNELMERNFLDYDFHAIPSIFLDQAIESASIHNAALEIVRTGNYDDSLILSDEERKIIGNQDYKDRCYELVEMVVENDGFPITDRDGIEIVVFNLFQQAFQSVSNCDDIEEIINAYASILEKNELLSDDSKAYLYESLAIAAYSYVYWDDQLYGNR